MTQDECLQPMKWRQRSLFFFRFRMFDKFIKTVYIVHPRRIKRTLFVGKNLLNAPNANVYISHVVKIDTFTKVGKIYMA